MLKVGDKVKIKPDKLKYYCDKHGWDFKVLYLDSIIIRELDFKNSLGYKSILSEPHFKYGISYFYPVDCLMYDREKKLKKILCIK